MDNQIPGHGHNKGHVPQIRHTLSATFERLRQQTLAFRPRRTQQHQGHGEAQRDEGSTRPFLPSTTRTQTFTCAHIYHSWFSDASLMGDCGSGDTDAESARATLKELLTESVIFGRISAFYPPHPPPSMDKQLIVRSRLLAALESSIKGRGGPFSTRQAPMHLQEGYFTRFPDLPAEIRLEIWLAALPGPGCRTLHIGQKVGEPYSWTARLPMPALSRVCHESREVVLKTVFPIYGHAPYRSGPGSLQSVMRRFVASWGTPNDYLDLGATSHPSALRCGDYLERVQDFHAVAQGLTSILRPTIPFHERNGSEQSASIPKGVKRLMVVIQVVYITHPTPSSSNPLGSSPWLEREVENPLAEDNIRVCEVNDLVDAIPFNANSYSSAVYRRPKEHHSTTVASLYDRTRINALLALGNVTGNWTDYRSRLRALHYHSNAFCMDCLLEWWERYALVAAREALLGGNQATSLDTMLNQGMSADDIPELVPAVRFKVQWPGLEEHLPAFSEH